MATTADFKNGMCLDIDGTYFFIVEFLHVKPGKGPAFVRTKLKNVKTGRVIDKTWNSGVKVEEVRIERRPYQFLYKDDIRTGSASRREHRRCAVPQGGRYLRGYGACRFGDYPYMRDAYECGSRDHLYRTRYKGRYRYQHIEACHFGDRRRGPCASVLQYRRQGAYRHPRRFVRGACKGINIPINFIVSRRDTFL